jgi:acetyl esterase/lipase
MPVPSKRIVHTVDAMAHVRALHSTVVTRDGGELSLDVYAPPALSQRERRPVVFLVHGGPIPLEMAAPTTWGVFQSWAELLAASGLVAVMFNHRLHALTDYERSQADIADTVEHVRAQAETFQIDRERVALWYFSGAGPQLSWLLRARPAYVRCAAAFYAMLDVQHLVPPESDPSLLRSAAALSPVTHLRAGGAGLPLFVARAGLDSQMVNAGLDAFVREALTANVALDFMNHPEGVHCFECLTDDRRTREIIQAAVAFTRRHLEAEG